MPYAKGQSGNPKGRPKQTAEQKSQKEQFQRLLKSSTVEALQSIIQIASDRYNKDRFNACKYIIDKAYGANTAFLLDGTEDTAPTVIRIVPYPAYADMVSAKIRERAFEGSKSSAEQAFDRLKESELKEAEQGLASVYMQGFHLRNIEKQVNAFKKPSAWNPDEQTA